MSVLKQATIKLIKVLNLRKLRKYTTPDAYDAIAEEIR